MDIANRLELHYYFNDESHSMDAIVRNKCEAELLAIIYEASVILGFEIKVDAEVFQEGGLKDIWKFLGRNSAQIAIVISIITLILSQIPKTDSEYESLQKELVKLSIQEKKLSIKKLQTELEEDSVSQETVKSVTKVVNTNYKIVTRKSNLYKQLSNYEKVTKLGVTSISEKGEYLAEERMINRTDFKRFILHSNELKPELVDGAQIEIVAPVLKEGNYKWKGVFEEESISFSMKDKDFKEAVLDKRIGFKHGSSILCVLNIHKKIDETGEIVVKGYSVDTVLEKIDGDSKEETPQGTRYKFTKKQKDNQSELFAQADA